MTWLVEWIGKHVGSWLGATEPEPVGSMSATLTGSCSVSGKLGASGVPPGKGDNKHKRSISAEDEELLLLISAYYGISSNN